MSREENGKIIFTPSDILDIGDDGLEDLAYEHTAWVYSGTTLLCRSCILDLNLNLKTLNFTKTLTDFKIEKNALIYPKLSITKRVSDRSHTSRYVRKSYCARIQPCGLLQARDNIGMIRTDRIWTMTRTGETTTRPTAGCTEEEDWCQWRRK